MLVTSCSSDSDSTSATVNTGNNETTQHDETVEVESVSLSETVKTINVNENFTLTATITPENATNKTLSWSSSDSDVASVENGIVTAKKKGSATITVTVGEKTATCVVTVNEAVPENFVPVSGTTVNSAVTGSQVFIAGRELQIKDFWICDHEVTQKEYQDVMESNPSYFQDNDADKKVAEGEIQENRPIENVSWYDALVYCNKRSIAESLTPCYTISNKTDPSEWGAVPTSSNTTWDAVKCNWDSNGYRLPTEAEWEYAARGGKEHLSDGYKYAGCNEDSELENFAWYEDNSKMKTHEVKKKQPNVLGLYDMSGNVWEWCWDWYGTIDASLQLYGPASDSAHPLRGGDYGNNADYCTSTYRGNNNNPVIRGLGFRVVRSSSLK